MHKAASRKIGIFLSGFILMACVAFLPASLCGAGMNDPTETASLYDARMHDLAEPASPSGSGMNELTDGEMAAVYGFGFSTFTLNGDQALVNFDGMTLRTWTEISSMKMGYYNKGSMGWDNDWTNVSLGSQSNDLVARGLYIDVRFSNISDPATRRLEYIRIGTNNLTGAVSANFNGFSGTLDNGTTNYSRANLGTSTITSAGGGFYMALERNSGGRPGYTFHWNNATITTP